MSTTHYGAALPPCQHLSGRLKKSYRSPAKARQAAKASGQRMRPYQCPRCHLWHISSQPDRDS